MARGGARPGAGRPKGVKNGQGKAKKTEIPADVAKEAKAANLTPLEYMLKVMNDPKIDAARRDRMAVAAAPFVHGRASEKGGKKQEQAEKAKGAASGRFAPRPAPLTRVK